MKSVFNTSNSTSSKSTFSQQINSLSSLTSSNVYQVIFYYSQQYTNNNLDYLNSVLTPSQYQNLSIQLYNLRKEGDLNYETIRENVHHALNVMYQATLTYNNYSSLQGNYVNTQQQLSILDDPQALQNHLKGLMDAVGYSEKISVTMDALSIDPFFMEYYKIHGIPSSGVFAPDKLAQLVESNKQANINLSL
jgi:hypothetical protein